MMTKKEEPQIYTLQTKTVQRNISSHTQNKKDFLPFLIRRKFFLSIFPFTLQHFSCSSVENSAKRTQKFAKKTEVSKSFCNLQYFFSNCLNKKTLPNFLRRQKKRSIKALNLLIKPIVKKREKNLQGQKSKFSLQNKHPSFFQFSS